ncbi:DUF6101 family protein [Bosea sp. (in: a-proteobacteria)]|uniref:DUF6101 family protein n=1 Tax=Bosea sp. (in: a-proteobacteria) TaxID=1871050 RepID=UPI0025B88BB8|nr:DUF6101 family protein [Bosea sp. (in: a-proteobacteria)]MBR3192259.1 hypothetical protein [Bosea sp. (in: a-proteobacteria)]
MASVTPAAGEAGCVPAFPGSAHNQSGQPSQPAQAPQQSEGPRIERVGPVRILRGGKGWRGIALRLVGGVIADDDRFQLALTAGDGRSVVVAVIDQDDAIAVWRDAGRASGLPLLLDTSDGAITEPYPQVGRVALGAIRIRRRHALLAGRRPRFLTRRKTSRLPERPVVIRGEILS